MWYIPLLIESYVKIVDKKKYKNEIVQNISVDVDGTSPIC